MDQEEGGMKRSFSLVMLLQANYILDRRKVFHP